MTVQTSYLINQAVAYLGQLADIGPNKIGSRDAEDTIVFGIAVGRGTDVERQCLPGLGGGLLGISVRSLEREGATGSGLIDYQVTETVGILESGSIYVACPAGCSAGDPVKFVDATGVLNAGAAVAGETTLDDAVWETTTTAGQIGIVNLGDKFRTTAGV